MNYTMEAERCKVVSFPSVSHMIEQEGKPTKQAVPFKYRRRHHQLYPDNGTNPAICGDNCGTMPECAPLAVPYVPFQQSNPKRYSQADALANGTLYPGLNLPFMVKPLASPLAQSPMTELQALEFVLNELALYLDTHPSDSEAFELFRQYNTMEKEARAAFAQNGTPISRGETAESKTYTWLKDPWPWNYQEGGMR